MEIKVYQPNDEVAIAQLFNLAFQKKLSADYVKWRFLENPFLKEPMINLMWDNGKLVGHHAVSASEIVYKNKIYLSSLCGTAMTHPDYEGQGIYGKLALSLYDRISEDHGLQTIITFPARAASHYSLVKKIKYSNVGYLPTLKLNAKSFKKTSLDNIHRIEEFELSHADFIQATLENLGFEIYLNKSVKYLNWRYTECPINEYYSIEYRYNEELKGLLIAKIYKINDISNDVDIDIVDLFCNDDLHLMAELFSGIIANISALEYNVQNLNCWISLFDRRHLELERLGFVMSTPITYFCVKSLGRKLSDVDQFRKWYISMGDSDVY